MRPWDRRRLLVQRRPPRQVIEDDDGPWEDEPLEERTRAILRNPDWNQMLDDLAEEAGGLVDELERAPEERLRAVADYVRRIANGAAIARAAIRAADEALLGEASR